MVKAQIYLSFIIFVYLSSVNFSRINARRVAEPNCGEGGAQIIQSQADWCVAKPGTDKEKLVNNINYACSKIDCTIISKGGPCYTPDDLHNMASVAMNLYFQAQGRNYFSCNFECSGTITITDPSNGSCIYQFRK